MNPVCFAVRLGGRIITENDTLAMQQKGLIVVYYGRPSISYKHLPMCSRHIKVTKR